MHAIVGRLAPPLLVNGWMEDICLGMAELHREKIIQVDLKPANVLLDANNRAFIADFGMSTVVAQTIGNASAAGGTANYQYDQPTQSNTYFQPPKPPNPSNDLLLTTSDFLHCRCILFGFSRVSVLRLLYIDGL